MRGLRTAWILAADSWRENLRGRFFTITVVFGVVILYLSLLLGVLASDQEARVLMDFGLSFIELLGLAGAVFAASTVVLREMETKTIYLILTRPVSPGQYLMGRWLGVLLSAAASMGLMAAAHLTLLFAKGWTWQWAYLGSLGGSFLKVLIMSALAIFLALFSSSVLTALSIVFILWSLGHFLPEIRFMIAWGPGHLVSTPLMALSWLVPDLQLFNLRDRLGPVPGWAPERGVWAWLLYAGGYAGAWLAAARWLFSRKEF